MNRWFLFAFLAVFFNFPSAFAGRVGVLADIEGDWRKIQAFVDQSEDLLRIVPDPSGDPCRVEGELSADSKLVFLGDSIDKGPDNFKVLNFLVHLKQKYPDRVILIQGNRDVNKLRFNWELAPSALALNGGDERFNLDRFRMRSWADSFAQWSAKHDFAQVDGVPTDYSHGAYPVIDSILKAKWMLRETMGSPTAFEDVKHEMGRLAHKGLTDAEILEVLLGWVAPGGLLADYLLSSQLAYLDEETGSLFVHGGLNRQNFGVVPESRLGKDDALEGEISDLAGLQAWIGALNRWSHRQVQSGLEGDFIGALGVIEYQEPEVVRTASGHSQAWGSNPNSISVAQARPWSPDYNLNPFHDTGLSSDLIARLRHVGVSKLFFGHSPVGQVPVLMKSEGMIVVACDTSVTAPPRNAYIEVTPEDVRVRATYVSPVGAPVLLVADSSDPAVGVGALVVAGDGSSRWVWSLGRRVVGEDPSQWPLLRAQWQKGPGPFGVPTYSE